MEKKACKIMPSILRLLIVVMASFFSVTFAQSKSTSNDNGLKGKYRSIEVVKLNVDSGVDIPANQVNVVWLEIIDELHKLKKFDRIIKLDPNTALASHVGHAPKIRLESTIARYFALIPQKYTTEGGDIGTRLKLRIKFIDASDGTILLEKEIDRKIYFGIYQFTLDDVGRKVAKDIAKLTKRSFF